MIVRKVRYALIPAVMVAMVACNVSDQAHTPESPASPAAPSEAKVAVDSSLEGVEIDQATMDSLRKESEALGNGWLTEKMLDSATMDSLIRLSGTSDSAIERRALELAEAPIAAKTSAASKPCTYERYRWAGGSCNDPYPAWGYRGVVYVSPRIGRETFLGIGVPRIESMCWGGPIKSFGVETRWFPPYHIPEEFGRTHVSSIFHSCERPSWYNGPMNPYFFLPKIHPNPNAPHDKKSLRWDGLLIGLEARSGDWIDALGPIFLRHATPEGRLSAFHPSAGKRNGGTPKAMLCPRNYYVAGFYGYRDKENRHGLTGLRMVCYDFRGP